MQSMMVKAPPPTTKVSPFPFSACASVNQYLVKLVPSGSLTLSIKAVISKDASESSESIGKHEEKILMVGSSTGSGTVN